MGVTGMKVGLEVMATSLDGVREAVRLGVDRVELCQDMVAGGTAPSIGLIQAAWELAADANVALMVMIRPRGGHFVYDAAEVQVMLADIAAVNSLGVTGIVTGALTNSGEVDIGVTRQLVSATAGRTTFHRAVDVSADVIAAASTAWDLGCDAVLSSGGESSATAGIATLREMRQRAPGPGALIAAGGIQPENVVQIVTETGVGQVHASARTSANAQVSVSLPLGPAMDWDHGSWPIPSTSTLLALKHELAGLPQSG